jgi:tyrosyl-tRNA synthetase
MGRKQGELQDVAQFFYPAMQVSDIFQLECDICQLGIDQRRANMLAREIGPKIGLWKPVAVHHHMLMGLQGTKTPEGFETDRGMDQAISSKMSKSKPESAIYVHDTGEEIKAKIQAAFCPPKEVQNNPILDYSKHIIFRKRDSLTISRPAKYGGDLEISSFGELESSYGEGKIHPLDLKNAVADVLDELISPIRSHFEEDSTARELYQHVKSVDITR